MLLIRAVEAAAGHHTPIIAVTAHATQADRRLSAGMDGFIFKPIDPQVFAKYD